MCPNDQKGRADEFIPFFALPLTSLKIEIVESELMRSEWKMQPECSPVYRERAFQYFEGLIRYEQSFPGVHVPRFRDPRM